MKDDYYIIYEGDEDTATETQFREATESSDSRRKEVEERERRRLQHLADASDDDLEAPRERKSISPRLVWSFVIPGAIIEAIAIILYAIQYPSGWYAGAAGWDAAMQVTIPILIGVGLLLLLVGDLLSIGVRRSD